MTNIRAGDGTDFFLFWAVRQDLIQNYGQKPLLGAFVRKTEVETFKTLRANTIFYLPIILRKMLRLHRIKKYLVSPKKRGLASTTAENNREF